MLPRLSCNRISLREAASPHLLNCVTFKRRTNSISELKLLK
jgi:hypothetical protein